MKGENQRLQVKINPALRLRALTKPTVSVKESRQNPTKTVLEELL